MNPQHTSPQDLSAQQRPWAKRLAKLSIDNTMFEFPDFAPESTDPALDEITEAEAKKLELAGDSWDPDDSIWDLSDDELDEFGNPMAKAPRPAIPQQPWSQRTGKSSNCEAPDSVQSIQAFLRESFPSILLGAALNAKQPYLVWNIRTFLNTFLNGNEANLRLSCWKLLKCLQSLDSNVYQNETTAGILFHLLVEPFALMHQSTESHLVQPSSPSAHRL